MSVSPKVRTAWFHVDMDGLDAIFSAHGRSYERSSDPFYASAVDQSLEFFDAHDAKATYFVIASDLDHPDKRSALERVVDAGHEIGCHGLSHRYLNRLDSEVDRRREIVDGRAMIQDGLGVPCKGFRAPGYSMDYRSLELVRDAGYLYDSSVFPDQAFRTRLGLQRLLPDPFRIFPGDDFFEVPLPTSGPGRPPFHPCYAFYLGAGHFRRGLRRHSRRSDYLTLLFHLTDFAERQPLRAGLRMMLYTNNLRSADGKQRFLDRLVKHVRAEHALTTTEAFLDSWPESAPELEPSVVLGISTTHETGACVVRDGKVVAALGEERMTRRKLDVRYPPEDSIREAIRISGVDPEEIGTVAIAGLRWDDLLPRTLRSLREDLSDYHALNDYFPHFGRVLYRLFYFWRALGYRKVLRFLEREYGIHPHLRFVEHHEAHAASAFLTGEADRALIVTCDGVGDDACITFSRGENGTIRRLETIFYPHSLGQFYTACTQILGFRGGRHEGKITGLSGFGKPDPEIIEKLERTILVDDGGFRLHKRYYAEGFIRFKLKELLRLPFTGLDPLAVDYRNYKPPLKRLLKGYDREDVAYAFQHILEREMIRLCSRHVDDGPLHMVLAGGVFANVKLNMALSQALQPESIYIFPAMGDGGLCAGAALSVAGSRPEAIPHVYLGTEYGEDDVEQALSGHTGIRFSRPDDLERRVAELLADEKIVARFDGAMEFGPRALGNRSILYHCGDPSVNAWLNKQLKRTEFMPFAPICLYEDAAEYFDIRPGEMRPCEFMTLVVRCTDRMQEDCPAAVHVDGTARPQLVRREVNPGMHRILQRYRDLTGISCVINTSFNMHEEPIVRTPDEAVRAFRQSHLDHMALGPFLIEQSVTPDIHGARTPEAGQMISGAAT